MIAYIINSVQIGSVVSEEKMFKNVQHVEIYLPCNFEVNPITHFD
jgi:hypothetical protein